MNAITALPGPASSLAVAHYDADLMPLPIRIVRLITSVDDDCFPPQAFIECDFDCPTLTNALGINWLSQVLNFSPLFTTGPTGHFACFREVLLSTLGELISPQQTLTPAAGSGGESMLILHLMALGFTAAFAFISEVLIICLLYSYYRHFAFSGIAYFCHPLVQLPRSFSADIFSHSATNTIPLSLDEFLSFLE